MSQPRSSSLKVPYDLRMAKQIERRMIIDAFQRMAQAGFEIRKYKYTGMGAIYFVDFVLFHRFLGITRMLSVEYSGEIKKRIRFNRPFACIDLEFKKIGDVIPSLNPDLRHILWLDYDFVMSSTVVEDVVNAAAQLSRGSILLITVDVEPPAKPGTPRQSRDHFIAEAERFCNPAWRLSDFAQSNLPAINISILQSALKQGMAGREHVEFLPIFNFLYADGHEMLTIGGVIGSDSEKRELDMCFDDAIYIRRDLNVAPYQVPKIPVTRKERVYLDAAMPAAKGWKPKDFELDAEHIASYADIYRFMPIFAELMI